MRCKQGRRKKLKLKTSVKAKGGECFEEDECVVNAQGVKMKTVTYAEPAQH